MSKVLFKQRRHYYVHCKYIHVFNSRRRNGIHAANLLYVTLLFIKILLLALLFTSMPQFSILGNIASATNSSIESVVSSGPGLVFITYPEVVLRLPGAPIWAILFFIMLAVSLYLFRCTSFIIVIFQPFFFCQILGIDRQVNRYNFKLRKIKRYVIYFPQLFSEFCMIEAFVTGIVDNWPNQLRKYRRLFVVSTIIVIFLLSLPMITEVKISRQIGLLIIYI